MSRIAARFAALKAENRAGFVAFVTAGDPDPETAAALMAGLPAAGADIIELGMPFSDPMADGPSVQRASQRALKAGMTLAKTLDQVARFRQTDTETPVVLMGYFNPIYQYGVDRFLADAKEKGVDGLIIVDLPPEEEGELAIPAKAAGIDFIYLTAPTTDDERLPRVLAGASGFVYYVSITGITGTRAADEGAVRQAVERLRRHTDLPLAIGFGIRTPAQAASFARLADAAVVGSAIVDRLAESLGDGDKAGAETVERTLSLVRELAAGVRNART